VIRFLSVLLFVTGFSSPFASAAAVDIAVIVNRGNPTNGVSFKQLERIFKQADRYWRDGTKISVVLQEAGTPEKEIALRKIYRMSDEEVKKFWLAKMFRGEIASFPTTFSSNEAVKRFVSQVPNAIGIIDSTAVDSSVRVLRIEGKLPGEAGYSLNGR